MPGMTTRHLQPSPRQHDGARRHVTHAERQARYRERQAQASRDALARAEAASRDAIQRAEAAEAALASRDAAASNAEAPAASRDAIKRAQERARKAEARATMAETRATMADIRTRDARDALHKAQSDLAELASYYGATNRKPSFLGKPERDKLVKILGMLGSDHLGEQTAAMAQANALLRKAGKSWAEALR